MQIGCANGIISRKIGCANNTISRMISKQVDDEK